MGFFGKGKSDLLSWQKVVLPNSPDKLIMGEKQLKQLSIQQAQNHMSIIQDCTKILSETVDPDTFFSRLDLLKEHSKRLVDLEPYVSFRGVSPTAAFDEVIEKEQEAIYQFIIGYYNAIYDKAASYKTEKAKERQFQKFYDSLQPYYERMNERNRNYIEYKHRNLLL